MFTFCAYVLLIIQESSCSYLSKRLDFEESINHVTACLKEITLTNFFSNQKFLTILVGNNFLDYDLRDGILKHFHSIWSINVSNGTHRDIHLSHKITKGKNVHKKYFEPDIKTDSYLLLVESLDSVVNFTSVIKLFKSYNSRANYIIYFNKIMEHKRSIIQLVLEMLWKMRCWKSIIIMPSNETYSNIYGLAMPRSAENCNAIPKITKKGTCVNGELKFKSNLFNRIIAKNLQDCVLDCIVMKYPPFVLDEKSGIEIEMLQTLSKVLHFSLNMQIEEVSKDWGERFPNHTWDGKLSQVMENGVFGIGNVQATAEMLEDFDISTGYITERMVWVVPIAQRREHLTSIYSMFSWKIWLTNVSIILIGSILYYGFSRIGNSRPFNVNTSVFLAIQSFIGNALPHQPKEKFIRAVLLSLSVYSIIIECIYDSTLIDSLTSRQYEHQISSEEEILRSRLEIGGIDTYREIFNVPTDESAINIYEQFATVDEEYETLNYWLKLVSEYRNTCTVAGQIYVRYLLSQNDPLVIEQGRPKIYILDNVLISYRSRIVMPKGHYLLNTIDTLLDIFKDCGFMDKWVDNYSKKLERLRILQRDTSQSPETVELSLRHLQGAFCILLLGYLCGLVTFALELLWAKIFLNK